MGKNKGPDIIMTAKQGEMPIDRLARPLKDLRISIIDRCNFRCPYCMPQDVFGENYQFLKKASWMTAEELTILGKAYASLGVNKIRITGGEPLLRKDVFQIISNLSSINGIDDVALTTNGMFLAKHAEALKDSGLDRVTVSLDSIDPKVFLEMSGGKGSVNNVLDGITKAIEVGFSPIKINVVVKRGVNDHLITGLIKHFLKLPVVIRFIEFMDVGTLNEWALNEVVTSGELIDEIRKKWQIEPIDPNYKGEVAKRYKVLSNLLELGFISSVSSPFCGDCHRARLAADGVMYNCLFASEGYPIGQLLRQGYNEQMIREKILSIWSNREDRYSEIRGKEVKIPLSKIEMFHMGG
jgi:cyclic pyranopterin phosphate synthase